VTQNELFDEWPERYEAWFRTPIGELVRRVEGATVADLLDVQAGDHLLDTGCGTGVFTTDFIAAGATVVGLDISRPMLQRAVAKTPPNSFSPIQADMRRLPFADNAFDKTVSITALEFIEDAAAAVSELFRITRPGGCVLVATLNSLSPWAERRNSKTRRGQRHILENAYYRSPTDLLAYSSHPGVIRTAVHFGKDDTLETALAAEDRGRRLGLDTGAFVAVRWRKPAPGTRSASIEPPTTVGPMGRS
jgi:ubiquinone/menaquinone biosynthesis C-methylase UbiE